MTYKVTQQCLDLVEQLIAEGYSGEITLSTSRASGAESILQGCLAIELSGFCKETLCIVEDTDNNTIEFVGRYNTEYIVPTVDGIVRCAWDMYKCYKDSGYSLPVEFKDLFKKYGYLKQKTIPSRTVWEEA